MRIEGDEPRKRSNSPMLGWLTRKFVANLNDKYGWENTHVIQCEECRYNEVHDHDLTCDVRTDIIKWKPPQKYNSEEIEAFGEDRYKRKEYIINTKLCQVISRDIVNSLGIPDKVYYYLVYKYHDWHLGSWASDNNARITKYHNAKSSGTLLDWDIAMRLYAMQKLNIFEMTSLVLGFCEDAKSTPKFYFTKASKVIDFINKYMKGVGQTTQWGSYVFGVPKEIFQEDDR
jgi:hypothetical protein